MLKTLSGDLSFPELVEGQQQVAIDRSLSLSKGSGKWRLTVP